MFVDTVGFCSVPLTAYERFLSDTIVTVFTLALIYWVILTSISMWRDR